MVFPPPPPPPKFIIDSNGYRLDIVIFTEADELQIPHTYKLKEVLKEFQNVDLEVIGSNIESQKKGYEFLRKRDDLREAMSVFDSSLPVRTDEFTNRELFIFLAASSFWSFHATEQVKKALLERIQKLSSQFEITQGNYKIFLQHFQWKMLSEPQRRSIADNIDKFLFTCDWFHILLNDYAVTFKYVDTRDLFIFLRETKVEEFKQAVKDLLKARIVRDNVLRTGGINKENYLLFRDHFAMDQQLESKIRLECFLSEECRRNWELLRDDASAIRILKITLETLFTTDLNREFDFLRFNRLALKKLSLLCYKDNDLCERVASCLGNLHPPFRDDLEKLGAADKLENEVTQLPPSASLTRMVLLAHVREFKCFLNNETNISPILGVGLDIEGLCVIARILTCREIDCFIETEELKSLHKLFKTLLLIVSQIVDLPLIEKNATVEKILNYLIQYVHEYPHPTLHDPILAGELRDRVKVGPFIAILRTNVEFMDAAKQIFKIPFDKL